MDPMTVVIVTNNLGEICHIYSALPIRVIKVDGMGHGGEILVENTGSMPGVKVERVEAIIKTVDDPYHYLDHIQRERIQQVAIDSLCEESADGGFRRGVMSAYVEKMTTEEMLNSISSEDESLRSDLGFDPETGKDYVPDPIAEELKKPCTLNWGRGRTSKVWHICTTEPKPVYPGSKDKTKKELFEVNTICGMTGAVIFGQPTPIDCTDQPAFTPGSSSVCPECVKYRLQTTYPEAK